MHRGCKFYVTLTSGVVSLALLLTGVCLPAQLVFDTQPYARLVLLSDQLDQWSVQQLGLDPAQLDMVKLHHKEYVRRNSMYSEGGDDDDDSSEDGDSDSSSDEQHKEVEDGDDDVKDNRKHTADIGVTSKIGTVDEETDEVDDKVGNGQNEFGRVIGKKPKSGDSSSSSSDDEDEDSSNSDEVPRQTLRQKLQDQPRRESFSFGLFRTRRCVTRQSYRVTCSDVLMTEAFRAIREQAGFVDTYVNMPMWNDLRVESLFSVVACAFGLVCLCASLRPCCESKRMPVYLSALSFCISGILVFIPIVRLVNTSRDIQQNLEADYNITTTLCTPWSLVAFGLSSPLALLAAFLLVATKWYRSTIKWKKMWAHKTEKDPLTTENALSDVQMVKVSSHATT